MFNWLKKRIRQRKYNKVKKLALERGISLTEEMFDLLTDALIHDCITNLYFSSYAIDLIEQSTTENEELVEYNAEVFSSTLNDDDRWYDDQTPIKSDESSYDSDSSYRASSSYSSDSSYSSSSSYSSDSSYSSSSSYSSDDSSDD